MASERSLVESALDDAASLGWWRWLARRARTRKLYFQLRAEGVGRRRSLALARRTRKAAPLVHKKAEGRDVALKLILA